MKRYTKLQAVNRILRESSEAPVASLDEDPTNENLLALQILDEVILDTLIDGIHGNVFTRTFEPDDDKHIFLPNDVITAEAWSDDVKEVIAVTGTGTTGDPFQLYDTREDTDEFDEKIMMRVYLHMDFEDIPPHVQKQIIMDAAEQYQNATVGDPRAGQRLEMKRQVAEAKAKARDMRLKRRNYFDGRARSNGPKILRTVRRAWE